MTEHSPKDPVNVIEVRAAANGFVISAWHASPYQGNAVVRGYETYVAKDPTEVGQVIGDILSAKTITSDVAIPPARELP